MKAYFKKVLSEYKGQVLDEKLIRKIASECEANIESWMRDENFYLLNAQTGVKITTDAEDKTFAIRSVYDWNETREYSTLTSALKASNKPF